FNIPSVTVEGMSQHQYALLLQSGNFSRLSSQYIAMLRYCCFSLFRQMMRCAFSFVVARAGKSIAARMAMMAMTTKSSIRVKALLRAEAFDAIASLFKSGFNHKDGLSLMRSS